MHVSCHRRLILLLFLLEVIPLHSNSHAQIYPFKNYSTADGLPQGAVLKVFQDSQSYLWFATRGGVSKYDGLEFLNYLNSGNARSVVTDIFEDEGRTLWFATEGNGIAKLRQGDTSFHWMTTEGGILPHNAVRVISKDAQHNIWIGTDGGLVLLRPDGTFHVYSTADGLPPHNPIWSIAHEQNRTLWVGTTDGLFKCTVQSNDRLITKQVIEAATLALIVLRNGDMLIGTFGRGSVQRGNILRYRAGTIDTLISYSKIKDVVKGLSFCEDRSGKVWIGTSYGIHIMEKGQFTRLREKHGVHNEYIHSIIEDREGTLWFGTADGVLKLPPRRLINYTSREGLSSYMVTAMLQDHRRNLWFGTYNGLTRLELNGNITRYGEEDGLYHRVIESLAEDTNGNIWIGTGGGLNIITGARMLKTGFASSSRFAVRCIIPNGKGGMLLGTTGKIAEGVKGHIKTLVDDQSNIPPTDISNLCIDREGRLWFGTDENGAGYYWNGTVHKFSKLDGLPDERITDMQLDDDGTLWVATQRGVARWVGNRFEQPTFTEQALMNSVVSCIFQDSAHHLWFGTEHGAYGLLDSAILHFGSEDGLAAEGVSQGLTDSDGNLWFGTHGGVTRLDKESMTTPMPRPEVLISAVKAGDDEHHLGNKSDLSYQDRTLTFMFYALSFIDEKNVQFQWMMRGFDRDWLLPRKEHQVRYMNLDPGDYVFVVRARNRNGRWSEPKTFSFSIAPPYWRTWWFWAIMVFVVVGTTASVVDLLHRRRLQRMLEMERLRTRIASDLHDDVGSTLTKISLYSELFQAGIDPTKAKSSILKIGSMSRELLTTMSDIVWSIDARNDTLGDLIDRMRDFVAETLSPTQIDVRFECEGLPLQKKLPVNLRQNLYLIFKEAINNIAKHARASKIAIQVKNVNGQFLMIICDNGQGFPKRKKLTGHGLGNMEMRAHLIGARIEMTNDQGTKIELTGKAL